MSLHWLFKMGNPSVDGSESGAVKKVVTPTTISATEASLAVQTQTRKRGMLIPLRRVPVECMEFEQETPEFPDLVDRSWHGKFDVGANSYVLIIDQCATQPWMVGDLFDRSPHLANITTFCMVKFDNVINRMFGTTYNVTPRNDSVRKRLTNDGLAELFSHLMTALETFGAKHDVPLFVACAYTRQLERLYRYQLTRAKVAGYVAYEFTPANEQAHFAFARRQE